MRANWKELEAEKKMCDALRELFAEDMLEETAELIQQIYDVLDQCAPDYNVQEIYQILRKKAVLIVK